MKKLSIVLTGLLLAACNQTAQQAIVDNSQGTGTGTTATYQVASTTSGGTAQDDMQNMPPIYMPLVDMHKKSKPKFEKDHAECRLQAEPQERAARAAMAQAQSGAAIQAAGIVASVIPVSSFRQAANLARASNAAQDVGGAVAQAGAANNANATADYALVVNNCLSRRGYLLLRT